MTSGRKYRKVSRKIFIALFCLPSITERLVSLQALREILEQVRTFSKLEALLLRKKSLRNGDSLQRHSEKVRNCRQSRTFEFFVGLFLIISWILSCNREDY